MKTLKPINQNHTRDETSTNMRQGLKFQCMKPTTKKHLVNLNNGVKTKDIPKLVKVDVVNQAVALETLNLLDSRLCKFNRLDSDGVEYI